MSLVDYTLALIVSVLLCSISAKPTPSASSQTVEVLKQQILSSLGYKEPPVIRNINSSIQQQRAMIRKYKEHIEGKGAVEEERYPETVSVYKPKDSVETHHGENPSASNVLLNFDIEEKHPDDPHMETIISRAHLKFHSNVFNNVTTQIRIHSNINNDNLPINSFVFSDLQQNVDAVYLDISNLVQTWLEGQENSFGITVSFSEKISDVLKVNSDKEVKRYFQENMEPVLEVFSYKKQILGREKRQVDTTSRRDCVKGDGENRCCRFRSYISFKDIGWDNWIVKPSGYEAYFCDGTCPHRFKMANTFAGIKSILSLKHPSTFKPPCCVPSKLTSLTILHRDETGQFVFMNVDDMLVQDCKCA